MDVGIIYSTHPQFAVKRLTVPQAYALWTPERWDLRLRDSGVNPPLY